MNDEHEKQELLKLCADWAEAMVANDAERIGSFMADDWVMVSERGVSTKAYFLDFVRSGALTHDRFQAVGDTRVEIYSDAATVIARVVNTAYYGGQRFDADEWTSDIFVRRGGKRLCVLSHITPALKEIEDPA